VHFQMLQRFGAIFRQSSGGIPIKMKGSALVEAGVQPGEPIARKARGCMLGLMVGDALGAAVEGCDRKEIRRLSKLTWGAGTQFVQDYVRAVPMGTFVAGPEPGTYRAAFKSSDTSFVPTGPPSNTNTDKIARKGMYTDDTNSCLAVGISIAECRGADAAHVARTCAELFLPDEAMTPSQAAARQHPSNEAFRGCPPTAKRVLECTLEGMSPAETGLPPNFPFQGGSFANGGAMRISPLAIAYRGADAKTLRQAVAAAICSSHRHPEAVDFAVVQAAAVQRALFWEPGEFDGPALLAELASMCETEGMRTVISATAEALRSFPEGGDELETLTPVVEACSRPGSSMGFQIASVHMAPCVLWAACLHHQDPRRALQAAIDLGGDTDTTASMVGAIVGALHGEEWCSASGEVDLAAGLENGYYGRDFALGLAERLVRLDIGVPAN